jgi:NAD(P)-dependent dehydrogenase (short-subunit alcohol dehydrogenase family)
MGALSDKIIAVAGGTGSVGQGIVRTLLKEEATVIVPCRKKGSEKDLLLNIQDLRSGKLHLIFENISEEKGALQIREDIHSIFGPIDMAVASLGGWWQGATLFDLEINSWQEILQNNLTSHFMAQKTFIPLLKNKGSYMHINGLAAEEAIPKAGPLCMAAAAQKMMMKTLSLELQDTNIRTYELILGYMKTRERILQKRCKDEWYTPEEVGEYIISLYLQKNSHYDELTHRLISK